MRQKRTPELPDLHALYDAGSPVLWGGERYLIEEYIDEGTQVKVTMSAEHVVLERKRRAAISTEQIVLGELVAKLGSHHPMTEAARAALEGKQQ